jgi:hypothetical protein
MYSILQYSSGLPLHEYCHCMQPLRNTLHMQRQQSSAHQQASEMQVLTLAVHQGAHLGDSTLTAQLQKACSVLKGTGSASEEGRGLLSKAALSLLKELSVAQQYAQEQAFISTEGLGPLPLQPAELQELLADLAGEQSLSHDIYLSADHCIPIAVWGSMVQLCL